MKLEFYNCPQPEEFNKALIKDAPAFLDYRPDFSKIHSITEEYKKYKNIVVIGHGGSITSLQGMYYALHQFSTKHLYIVSTIDPDYIAELKKSIHPQNTLVIAISKSGETVTQIEALLQFAEFPLLAITSSMGPLLDVAKQLLGRVVLHPPIGGRFSGMTEVALLPAAICGLEVEAIYNGAQVWYKQFADNNAAYQAASILRQLEDRGTVDVFMPIYDSHLFPLSSLIVQLCHESFGKDGEGQTYFTHHAPESQHHTNQRFFGGRKNIAGWFMATDQPLTDAITTVPKGLQNIPLKDNHMLALDGIPLSAALRAEMYGTLEDARLQNIPVIAQSIPQRTPQEVGGLIAFWQLYAVYSALLRNVDPYNQPQVENSKKISFAKRLQQKGLI